MTQRQRLPYRRGCESFSFRCGGLSYVATISRFPNSDLAEIFISNHKSGCDADTAGRDSAVVCSIALQYGVPLETIRKALMRDSQGRPNGPLGAALDLIAGSAGRDPITPSAASEPAS